ncbi:hypothetical protein R75461_04794 [Paraburkholderia nemoris]|jgi:hypothetical protein|uniref:hypothetical protein n=1 Tax=Paraburkholderia TaxID=1822464 RepID=UPI00190BC0DE|nr:hypothetical protein [Paraburkholderia sediminicola]CAE6685911.1 hypothetical protein LMG22931_00055 [Paraburkholderia nemoris]CAE6792401.1 hypothetical protein R75461_04794 [Paraburkholderia nemoris]
MRIVVIDRTELIDSKVAKDLRARGHAVVAASPTSGVNAMTGEDLKEALTGANARRGTVNFDVVQRDARRTISGKHPRGTP